MKLMAPAVLLFTLLMVKEGKTQLRTAIAGGAQLSSVPGNSSPQWDTLQHKYSSRTGFHVGLIAETPFFNSSSLYFRTGMLYTNKGRNFSSTFDTAVSAIKEVSGRQFVNYMEIPVNLVYKKDLGEKSKLVFGGGPYVSFLFSGREATSTEYKNGVTDVTENTSLKIPRSQGKYNNIDVGVNAFAGVEFGKLFVNANFSKGLGDFYQAHNSTGKFTHQVMGVTVGLYLSGEKKRERKARDRDKDGIPDSEDKCPRQKGTALSHGCPDKDGDGVSDSDDNCPNLAGPAKRNGCPEAQTEEENIKTAFEGYAKRIQFKYKSAVLSDDSKEALDKVVQILKKNPKLNMLIEGYTSNDGNGKNHIKLSEARAESVKDYVVLSGIKAQRITALGRGTANALNKESNEAERSENRRVELKIIKILE